MRIIFFLIISLTALTALSQNNEYLIKQNGDSVFGNIKLDNKIFTVSNSSLNTVFFNATDVKKIHSPAYKGDIVLPCILHIYSDDLDVLLRYQYISGDRDTVLILSEVYSTPKINLYWGTDVTKMQYYFYKTPVDSVPVQLFVNYSLGGGATAVFEKKDVRGLESLTHLEVMKGFVNQLKLVMGDCKKLSGFNWDMLDYRVYSLKNLIKKYNKCK